jgi:hypothetical protein
MNAETASDKFSLSEWILRHAVDLAKEGYRLSAHQWKVLNALKECRSGNLGHVVMECDGCGEARRMPLSCGNRHCPRCTGPKREAWRNKQCEDLLPVPYYHLVFTVPHSLNALARDNREVFYNLLFEKAVDVLQQFARETYGGQLGITAVLHTWGEAMGDHYHLHLIVPGGALCAGEGGAPPRWVPAKPNCLFPVRQLALCFRGALLAGLEERYNEGALEFHSEEMKGRATSGAFKNLLRVAARPKWNVFAEKSHSSAAGAVNYLARYSNRVALDERRVERAPGEAGEKGAVLFSYKDNRDGKRKRARLSAAGLLARFALHILPPGFVRLRHYGILANGRRAKRLEEARASIREQGLATLATTHKPVALEAIAPCRRCGSDHSHWLMTVHLRSDGSHRIVASPRLVARRAESPAKTPEDTS